jgi:hypothetical protein
MGFALDLCVIQSIRVLEAALKASPASVVVAEPFLFNIGEFWLPGNALWSLNLIPSVTATLYELRSVTAIENKRNLLIAVAEWSGDGLKTACLKMPTN